MALTPQEKAVLDVYMDEIMPNSAERASLMSTDDQARATLAAWLKGAVTRRQGYIQAMNITAKKINGDLAVLNAAPSTITSLEPTGA